MNPQVLSSQNSFSITFLASFLIWFMFAGLLALWVIDGKIKREQVLHAFVATIVSWAVVQMVKSLFPTLRPYEINGGPIFTLTMFHPSGGFPSIHSAVAFALAVSIWLHDKKIGLLFMISAILVGIGRVLGNVHYFLDIAGGAVIGIIVALILERLHLGKLLK
jgi:undecaprenyl-diphosphatase